MRIPVVAGNWKMNTSVAEAVDLVHGMMNELEGIRGVEIVVCPPFISLYPVYEMLRGGPLHLGAQNMDHREGGAFTGEISGRMLAPIAAYVILGHSERRQYFGEDDAIVNLKLKAAQRFRLTPIVCVGERLEENEAGQTEAVIERQVRGAFEGIADPGRTIIAYEPVWAIGTGRAATAQQAEATIQHIRRTVAAIFGDLKADDIRILYGGSVTAANIAELAACPDIDGALVGGASLKGPDFTEICRVTADAKMPDHLRS